MGMQLDYLLKRIDTYKNLTGMLPNKMYIDIDILHDVAQNYGGNSFSMTYDYDGLRGYFEGIPVEVSNYDYLPGGVIFEPREEEIGLYLKDIFAYADRQSCISKSLLSEDTIDDISEEELTTILKIKQ